MLIKCEQAYSSFEENKRIDGEKKADRNYPGLVVVLNSSIAVGFLRGQLEYFQRSGFKVTLLCPKRRSDEWEVQRPDGVEVRELGLERSIAPLRDLMTLWHLWRSLRALAPSITNVGTPKAGLLGGFAAWLNRIPARFYTLHGLRFETTKGLKRLLLIVAERLACRFSHRVVCVSRSVREKAIAYGLTTSERSLVLGAGSCNGIDASRFAPTPELVERAGKLRQQMGIPVLAKVILFVGRLTRDKGIPELLNAFSILKERSPDLRLLLVGCCEKEDPLPSEILGRLHSDPNTILVGPVSDTSVYYAAADIVALPSHREGLPTVVLEAQAAGKPVVAANATGTVDVVVDSKTGLLFPVGDATALADALARLITDKTLISKLELAGQEQIKREFRQERIWDQLQEAYLEVLRKNDPKTWLLSRGPNKKKLVPLPR